MKNWNLCYSNRADKPCVITGDDGFLATLEGDKASQVANGAKMAAAPELYAALKEALAVIDNLHAEQRPDGSVQLGNRYWPIVWAASEALAKADEYKDYTGPTWGIMKEG